MSALNAAHAWEAVLGDLQIQVTRPSYETWLKETVGVAREDDVFVVGTPTAFVAEMLEQRMSSLISEAMERVTKSRLQLRFVVLPPPSPGSNANEPGDSPHTAPAFALGDDTPADAPAAQPRGRRPAPGAHHPVSLNSKYAFETFIVGKSNELAHAAALAVAEQPGHVYNPLVMYSGVGLGKTHLLHAIGQRLESTSMSLIYTTTEDFTSDYIKSIREGKTEDFRNTYRSADLLLLDDIQFLIGKEQTQEGFFHTFNALHMANRQIVITSDRPVAALTLLEDRIMSRLQGGLVVDIQPPDIETRMDILQAKAEQMGVTLNPLILEMLAERARTNIRELEGNLNRVVAYANLTKREITPGLVNDAIPKLPRQRELSDEMVLTAVASHYRVDREAIKGRKRDKKTVLARHVAMYLMREDANLRSTVIGRFLGGKDHTTVQHGCRSISNRQHNDSQLRRDIFAIRERLARA